MENVEVFKETLELNSWWLINLNAAPGPQLEPSITMAFSEEPLQKLIITVDNQILVSNLLRVEPHAVVMKATHLLEIVIVLNGQRDQLSAQYLPSLLTRVIGLENIPEPGGLLLRMDKLALQEFQLWWKEKEEEMEKEKEKEEKEKEEKEVKVNVKVAAENKKSKWRRVDKTAERSLAAPEVAEVAPRVAEAPEIEKAAQEVEEEEVEEEEEEEASNYLRNSSKTD